MQSVHGLSVRRIGLMLLVFLAISFLLGTTAYSMISLFSERRHSQDLATENQTLSASVRQLQTQLQSVTAKLNVLAVQPPTASALATRTKQQPDTRARPTAVRKLSADSHLQQLTARLADQQKQIASTREEVNQTREGLQRELNSTRDELGDSIAKNHEAVVLLEKRGERRYHEFQIDKSKQFHRVGPISVSVRKVNTKRKYYDIMLTVDDQQIEKKHVNLYEPLLVTISDGPRPIELVANEITNNQVRGYVSEPKYKQSELAVASQSVEQAKELQRR